MPKNVRLFVRKDCQAIYLPPLKKMIEMPRAKIVPQTLSVFERFSRMFERFTTHVEECGRDDKLDVLSSVLRRTTVNHFHRSLFALCREKAFDAAIGCIPQ